MNRNPLLTKIIKLYAVSVTAAPLIAICLTVLLKQNVNFISESTFFVPYFIIICFSLPSLLSKVIFKQNFFSLTSVLSFLYFPIIYLLSLFTHHTTPIDFKDAYFAYSILTIILWHVLIGLFILKAKIHKIEKIFSKLIYALIPFTIFIAINIFIRDYASIISTDILIHKTVLNGMQDPNVFGLMPATYSNTFTGQGYPIIVFHTFLYMISNAFEFQYHLVGYFVDIVLTLMCSLVIFRFLSKYYGSFWGVLGTIFALFTFENLAYTTHFFIPQTLTFFFFLQIISDKSLKLKQTFYASAFLIISHFFIGAFLAGFLLIKHLYFENKLLKIGEKNHNFLFFESLLLFGFIMLLNSAGFSIERYFQKETLDWFGNLSNPEFLDKFKVLFNLLGGVWLIMIPGLIKIILQKKRNLIELIGFFGIIISLSIYFLAPTFASKFFLGFGIFASIIIISWVKDLRFPNPKIQYLTIIIIIAAYILNFSTQFLELTRFLVQDNTSRTALTYKDRDLLDFWIDEKPECILISDPQTQLLIHSIGEGVTARGMYMTLESRQQLAEFVREPSQRNLINVTEIEELNNIDEDKICIGISQRLIEMSEQNRIWEELISTYQVDHKKAYLETDHGTISMLSIYPVIYQDYYHSIFLIRGGD